MAFSWPNISGSPTLVYMPRVLSKGYLSPTGIWPTAIWVVVPRGLDLHWGKVNNTKKQSIFFFEFKCLFLQYLNCTINFLINWNFRNPENHCRPYTNLPLVPIFCEVHSIPSITTHHLQIHFNIILPSASRSPQRLSADLPTKTLHVFIVIAELIL